MLYKNFLNPLFIQLLGIIIYLIIIYTGVLKGKSGRGIKQLLQADLSKFVRAGETESLQQRKLRKVREKG